MTYTKQLLFDSDEIVFARHGADDVIADLIARADKRPVRAMYGETYDRFSMTVDSLKYYSWLTLLDNYLAGMGYVVGSSVLIADTATTRNAPDEDHEALLARGRDRRDQLARVMRQLGLPLRVRLMSSFITSDDFGRQVALVQEKAEHHPELMTLVTQTVPEKYREVEQRKGWVYALEEIATIFCYDLKVGPPREYFYDEPARLVARLEELDPMLSVLLRPTFPLGLPMSAFMRDQELERFGVTAYKAGSRGLRTHRIVLEPGMTAEAARLLSETPWTTRGNLPNPLREFAMSCCLIRSAARSAFELANEDYLPDTMTRSELMTYCLRTVELLEKAIFSVS